jgi:hypothetical protein
MKSGVSDNDNNDKNVRTLSETPRRRKPRLVAKCGVFDRAVSREPLAVAADAIGMDFESCFGTFVPRF